jgi:ArsR family transcriptional regulator, virulence genes transcriptional regulator
MKADVEPAMLASSTMINPALAEMNAKAEEAARLLASLAHGKRLMALCHLLHGEKSVGQLANLIELSSTALSQHLARLRDLGLVETRRDAQTIFYRLSSPEVKALLETLYRLYCAPDANAP